MKNKVFSTDNNTFWNPKGNNKDPKLTIIFF